MDAATSSALGRLSFLTPESLAFGRGRSFGTLTLDPTSDTTPCGCDSAVDVFHPLRIDLRMLVLSLDDAIGGDGDGGRSEIESCGALVEITDLRTGYGDSWSKWKWSYAELTLECTGAAGVAACIWGCKGDWGFGDHSPTGSCALAGSGG